MTEIVIIGGGVVGATIAYELSNLPDLGITLIEENTALKGSTRAALGVLVGISSQKKSGRAWELRQTSIQRYPLLISELESLTKRTISHNSQGLVHLCITPESLTRWQTLQTIRQSQSWKIEIWNPQQLAENCPQIQHPDLIAAVYSPNDWQINPTELTQALLEGASLNGVTLQFGHKVNNLVIIDDPSSPLKRCSGIIINGHLKPLDYLVIAAGLGSVDVVAHLEKNVKMQPVLGQALQLRLDNSIGKKDFQPVITAEDVHIIPLRGGEYWLGATVEYPDAQDQVKADDQLLQEVLAKAISFCPSLAKANVIKTWSGQRPRPVGVGAPIIEKLTGYSNVVLATGHYRNGLLLAPATAQKVQDLITEVPNI